MRESTNITKLWKILQKKLTCQTARPHILSVDTVTIRWGSQNQPSKIIQQLCKNDFNLYNSNILSMMEQILAPPCELSYMRTEHGKSSDDYRCSRILPHITEQYQFRINNRLLIEKIINPRRDKTIIDSLAKTTCSQFYKKNTRTSKLEKNMKYRRKIMPQNI